MNYRRLILVSAMGLLLLWDAGQYRQWRLRPEADFAATGGPWATLPSDWQTVSAGSLSAHMNSQIDGLIAAAEPYSPSKLNLYSAVDDTNGTYTRNTSVWTGAVDLSGLATWSSAASGPGGPARTLGTLITPTDVIVANHAAPPPGTTYRFTDFANTTYTATVGAHVTVTGDLAVAHLQWNGPVPSTLKIMPILPSNYQRYGSDRLLKFFPVLCSNQYRQVFVHDSLQSVKVPSTSFIAGFFYHVPAVEKNRAPWTMNLITGDSSTPVMAVINGSAVLLCCTTFVSSGLSAADNIPGINAALAKLDAGGTIYTVTTANLGSPIAFPLF